ncbi:hypothetical protein BOTBODRAFT_558783 [Botryobasidium botryosum FD-172 SS1]|uniref:Uncharacterized protein n=1 Tax=Botryobasidium botryosum (strain FD-172 SS1) TaxID=930990 RepID=A0A067LZE1_BOTB1|nr:hypothetical protein BOTBODRAFT_558783 [Botryobasidium botryosum FD-172 SS1]
MFSFLSMFEHWYLNIDTGIGTFFLLVFRARVDVRMVSCAYYSLGYLKADTHRFRGVITIVCTGVE